MQGRFSKTGINYSSINKHHNKTKKGKKNSIGKSNENATY